MCYVTYLLLLLICWKNKSGVWSFCDSCPESYVSGLWTWSSEISNNSNFQTIWHTKAGAVEFSFSLSSLRQTTFDLCFQGHDPPLISFHPAIVTAELSLYDTPRYVLLESGKSWFSPPCFDTLVSVVTLFHLCYDIISANLISCLIKSLNQTWY